MLVGEPGSNKKWAMHRREGDGKIRLGMCKIVVFMLMFKHMQVAKMQWCNQASKKVCGMCECEIRTNSPSPKWQNSISCLILSEVTELNSATPKR